MPRLIRPRSASGFSLVELAISIVILAILAGGAISLLRLQTMRAQNAETRSQLQDAREAFINYAAVKAVLPCPATNLDGTSDACSGAINVVAKGRLPWKELGLPAVDVWGQSLYYAVTRTYMQSSTLGLNTDGTIELEAKLVGGTTASLANNKSLAFVVWSSGADSTNASASASASIVIGEAPDSDDLVVWVSRYIVLGRMLEAGRNVPTNAP